MLRKPDTRGFSVWTLTCTTTGLVVQAGGTSVLDRPCQVAPATWLDTKAGAKLGQWLGTGSIQASWICIATLPTCCQRCTHRYVVDTLLPREHKHPSDPHLQAAPAAHAN